MSEDRGEITEKLRKNVRAVLMSSPKGVLVSKFSGEYKSLVKEMFPWRSLGYKSAIDLLKAMPTVARLQYSEKDREVRVFAIADSSVFLPSWWKKYEGKSIVVPTHPVEQPIVRYSKKDNTGELYSLYVSFRISQRDHRADCSRQTAQKMKRELHQVMKQAGTPVDIHVTDKGYGFVRFKTSEEVDCAAQLFDRTMIAGTWVFAKRSRTQTKTRQTIKSEVPCASLEWDINASRAEEGRVGRLTEGGGVGGGNKEGESAVGGVGGGGGVKGNCVDTENEREEIKKPHSHNFELDEVVSDDSDSSWDDSLLLPLTLKSNSNHTTPSHHIDLLRPHSIPNGNDLVPFPRVSSPPTSLPSVTNEPRLLPISPPLVSPSPYHLPPSPSPPNPPPSPSLHTAESSLLSNSPFYRLQNFLSSSSHIWSHGK